MFHMIWSFINYNYKETKGETCRECFQEPEDHLKMSLKLMSYKLEEISHQRKSFPFG